MRHAGGAGYSALPAAGALQRFHCYLLVMGRWLRTYLHTLSTSDLETEKARKANDCNAVECADECITE